MMLITAAAATLAAATGLVPLTADVKEKARAAQVRDCDGFNEAAIYAENPPYRTAYLLARCLGNDVEGYEYPVLVDRGMKTHRCFRHVAWQEVGELISAGCEYKVREIYKDGRRML